MLAAPPAQGRISQLLPTVTCSTCSAPVPLSELVDHICKPPPPLPTQPSKTSLLTQRINAMTGRSPRESATTDRSSYSTQRSVSPSLTARARSPSPPPLPLPFPDRSQTRTPSSTRSVIPAATIVRPVPSRSRTPSVASIPRAPSAASFRSRTPSSNSSSNPPPIPRAPSAASIRSHASSNASVPSSGLATAPRRQPSFGTTNASPPLPRPSFGASPHPPPPQQLRRPSYGSPQQPVADLRRPSFGSPQPPPGNLRRPSFGSPQAPPRQPPFAAQGHAHVPPPLQLSIPHVPAPPGSPVSPGAHTIFDERDIDTKSGGEAGMAGVGRRGFAAAARAAMFAAHATSSHIPHAQPFQAPGRRPNMPPFLDIGAIVPSLPPIGSYGSPLTLSPHSGRSHSPPSPVMLSSNSSHASSLSIATLTHSGSTAATSPTLTTPPSPTPTQTSIARLPPSISRRSPPLSEQSSVPFPSTTVAVGPLTPTEDAETARVPFFADKPSGPGAFSDATKPTPRAVRVANAGLDSDYDDDEESIDDMALRLSRELEDLALDLLPQPGARSSRSGTPLSDLQRDNDFDDSDDDGGGLAYASSERSSVLSHRRVDSAQSARLLARDHSIDTGRTPQLNSFTHARTPSTAYSHSRAPSSSSLGRARTPSTSSSLPSTRALSINKAKSTPVTPARSQDPHWPGDGGSNKDVPPVPVLALDLAAALRAHELGPRPNSRTSDGATISRPDSRASGTSTHHRRAGSRGFGPTLGAPDTGTGPVRTMTPGSKASDVRDQVNGAPGAWGIVRAKTATGAEARVSAGRLEREQQEVRRGGTISGAIGSPGREKERAAEKVREKEKEKERRRRCVKCGTSIEDGRWVRVENGKGVLCGRCWKGMYLPKCRRCGLAIEKQAVSSSDGQLKGKYHRECFNCTTCQKPFPDKEFYVFDGRPYCAYHYHEANGSLCSAPSCGLPIEGPCAVSHAGQRYHPEHMTCEYVDRADFSDSDYSDGDDDDDVDADVRRRIGRETLMPGRKGKRERRAQSERRCTARLEEYWEAEGKMLCERHVRRVMGTERMRAERAQRRVTRFIDLNDFR